MGDAQQRGLRPPPPSPLQQHTALLAAQSPERLIEDDEPCLPAEQGPPQTHALPLSTGVTLYVAASDLMPEVNEERGIRMPLVVFLGVALFALCELLLSRLGL